MQPVRASPRRDSSPVFLDVGHQGVPAAVSLLPLEDPVLVLLGGVLGADPDVPRLSDGSLIPSSHPSSTRPIAPTCVATAPTTRSPYPARSWGPSRSVFAHAAPTEDEDRGDHDNGHRDHRQQGNHGP